MKLGYVLPLLSIVIPLCYGNPIVAGRQDSSILTKKNPSILPRRSTEEDLIERRHLALETCTFKPSWIFSGKITTGFGLGQNYFPGLTCEENEESDEFCDCADNTGNVKVLNKTAGGCGATSTPATTAVRFADLNGDGRAEYLHVGANGEVKAFFNGGPKDQDANAAQVNWISAGVISPNVAGSRAFIHFADLNGDGRAEFLRVNPDGSVESWVNLGPKKDAANPAQIKWAPTGRTANGFGRPGSGVRFADLNGDGKADYIWVDANGDVEAHLNLGQAVPVIEAAVEGDLVRWSKNATAVFSGSVTKFDNVRLADINGDGKVEYLSVAFKGGAVTQWTNGGAQGANAAQVSWEANGLIAAGIGTKGTSVHFADLNGDGRAEYLVVDPNTSAVTAYLNAC